MNIELQANDTIRANRVEPGDISVDGDLREWYGWGQRGGTIYTDLAFATKSGEEVIFEPYGATASRP